MAKFYTYLTIMVGIAALMTLAGFPTGFADVLSKVGLIPSTGGADFGTTTNWLLVAVIGLFASAAATGVIAGFFGRGVFDYVPLSLFAGASVFFLLDVFTSIVRYSASYASWISYPVWLIFGILGVGFVISAVDWVFNRGGS